MITELPQHLQQSIADEVIQRLKTLGARANISEQGAAKQFVSCLFVPVLVSVEEDEIIACDASPMSVVFLACHRVLKEICQLAELNSNSIFLKVNYEELKPISKSPAPFENYILFAIYVKGESFYNPHIPRVIRELRELELVKESEGACVISIEGILFLWCSLLVLTTVITFNIKYDPLGYISTLMKLSYCFLQCIGIDLTKRKQSVYVTDVD
ncbi:hypothetical protein G4B88_016724 [Cannabis sativa]|nr:hypothetical protein G4B88_016724 [Cannabis sativa]